jgi:cytoskeletal protein CcmA (bactofilin family)
LFASGKTITIKGTVAGDVYCAAQNIKITGRVEGDVLCAGQFLEIDGEVLGSVRGAAQKVTINGLVDRNVTTVAQVISLGSESTVNGEVYAAGQSLDSSGFIGKELNGGVADANLDGEIDGNVNVNAEKVVFGNNLVVGGNVTYSSDSESQVPASASVSGALTYSKRPVDQSPNGRLKATSIKPVMIQPARSWLTKWFSSVVIYGLLALLMVSFFPAFTWKVIDALEKSPLPSTGWGLVSIIVAPIVLLILVLTIIGIPVAILLGILWLFLIISSRIYGALVIGKRVLEQVKRDKKESLPWMVFVGIPLAWFLFHAPIVGTLVSIVVMFWSLGGFVSVLWYSRRNAQK